MKITEGYPALIQSLLKYITERRAEWHTQKKREMY